MGGWAEDRRQMSVTRIVTRLNVGGPARQELALTGALRKAGLSTELVTGRPDSAEGLASGSDAADKVVSSLRRSINPRRDLQAFLALSAHLRSRRPDVVHSHLAKAGGLGRLAARACGVPVTVHTFHGHVLQGYFSSRVTDAFVQAERCLARHTDALVAVSACVRDELLSLGVGRPDQWHVIPLGLDLEAFRRSQDPVQVCRQRLGLPSGGPLVALVGRLASVKDPGTFLQAARHVAEAFPAASFVVAGDGELRRLMERRGRELLGDRVQFLGWVDDMASLYRATDVVLLTSRHEGTPAALIEAGAAGCPVVATDVGGVRDVVTDGVNGYLVTPGDARAIASATMAVLSDPARALALGAAGRRTSQRFSVDRLATDLGALYETLLATRSPRRIPTRPQRRAAKELRGTAVLPSPHAGGLR